MSVTLGIAVGRDPLFAKHPNLRRVTINQARQDLQDLRLMSEVSVFSVQPRLEAGTARRLEVGSHVHFSER
jgi:hypothetical protein